MAKKSSAKKDTKKVEKTKKDASKKTLLEFDKKYVNVFLIVVFLIAAMWFAFYVRSGPINLSGLDERVEQSTYSQIQNIIAQMVESEYPNLDSQFKQEEIDRRFSQVIGTGVFEFNGQRVVVQDIIDQNAQYAKAAFKSDDNNQTYLNAIDPYHFLRYTELYDKNGYVGDSLVDGKPYLSYKLAPEGLAGKSEPEFHVWLESKFFDLYGVDYSSSVGEKTEAIFLIPVIFAMLSVIPLFFIIRRFSNELTAFFGSLLLVSIGTFVSRTVAGFVDTDAYNIFFPLVIVAFLVYAFVYRNVIATIVLAVLAGFFQGMFLWAWGPGWFIFVFVASALLGYFGYLLLVNLYGKVPIKEFSARVSNDMITLLSFVISSFVFTYVFVRNNIFLLTYDGVVGSVTGIAGISSTNIWPNVLSSVAELNPASFPQILSSVGGKFIFFLALLGILFLSVDFKKKEKTKLYMYKKILFVAGIIWFALYVAGYFLPLAANAKFAFIALLFLPVGLGLLISLLESRRGNEVFMAILLSIWMAGTLFMSLNGVRFILLMAPAFAIGFGVGIYYISYFINRFFVDEFKLKNVFWKNFWGYAVITAIFILLFVPVATGAIAISKGSMPNFDDAWYSTMEKIRTNSSEDAIITSWWDFGHFFAATTNRGVTFDGGSQGTPAAHWVGKLLTEGDEEVSQDILQMIVCSQNNAYDYIVNVSGGTAADGVKATELLYSTFGISDGQKREILSDYEYYDFTQEDIDNIMSELACENPPQNFLITSQDMVGKAGVWAHWGLWDFTKKYVHDNYRNKDVSQIVQELDKDEQLIQRYVNELMAIDTRAREQNVNRNDLVNQWFSPYPSYRGIGNCEIDGNSVKCGIGFDRNQRVFPAQYSGFDECRQDSAGNVVCSFEVDLENMSINHSSEFSGLFNSLYVPAQTGDIEEHVQNESGALDVVLLGNGDGISYLLADHPLGNSLFTKLFYLDGLGTKYFEKFDDVNSATGIRVITWDVLWDAPKENSSIEEIIDINPSDIEFEVVDEEMGELVSNNS